MSGLISVEEAGDQLTESEIIATCNLLLIAGHETTVNLIANAVLALLRHPDQWRALGADPVAPRRSSRRHCASTHRCNSSAESPVPTW